MNAASNKTECPHSHRHRLEYLFILMAGQTHSRFNSSYIFALWQSQHLSTEHTFGTLLTPTFNPFIFNIHKIFKIKRAYCFVTPLLQPKFWPRMTPAFKYVCLELISCVFFNLQWASIFVSLQLQQRIRSDQPWSCWASSSGSKEGVQHAANQLCMGVSMVLLGKWHGSGCWSDVLHSTSEHDLVVVVVVVVEYNKH